MVKNNRTNFEGINEDNAEKARLNAEKNITATPNPKHHTHGRFETEQQKEQADASHFKGDDRVVEFDDEGYDR